MSADNAYTLLKEMVTDIAFEGKLTYGQYFVKFRDRVEALPIITHTLPPQEIYDILHDYEVRGGTIPDIVDSWWKKETDINQSIIEKKAIKQ
jgi:hypothetical protein